MQTFSEQMVQCRNCGIAPVIDGDQFLIRPPGGHPMDKLHSALNSAGCDITPGMRAQELAIRISDHERLANTLFNRLHRNELDDTMIVPAREGQPDIDKLWSIMRLSDYAANVRGRWLVDLVESDRLTTYLQPIVDADARPIGHECLVRGFDPAGDLIPAGRMLEAAASPRLAAYFDRAARLKAVERGTALPESQTCFINFLPSTLYDPENCLRTTVDALETANIDPARVVFEVVETEAIDDMTHLRRIVDYYRNAGFRIALDDFGSGYNNLAHFVALQPDFIKVDKALVQNVNARGIARSLTEFVLSTARDHGIRTIAEGVEDHATFDTLKQMGADFFQGYYFAKPAPDPITGSLPQ